MIFKTLKALLQPLNFIGNVVNKMQIAWSNYLSIKLISNKNMNWTILPWKINSAIITTTKL